MHNIKIDDFIADSRDLTAPWEAIIVELAKYNSSGIESPRFIPVLITPYLTYLIDIRQEILIA
jgi:hypothetical protein